ncbi:hypothetical protein FACS1894153_3110 [Bacteroidia bacterium]|nr:hypothetical protein FACS1894153_3110 [Bacteroidia bacterium]
MFFLFCVNIKAQQIRFFSADSIVVSGYTQPFVGGLSNCIIGEIDLNCDGINDVLVYDNIAKKILQFIYTPTSSKIWSLNKEKNTKFFDNVKKTDWSFSEAKTTALPHILEWFVTADFNNDGKMDIFCYNGAGGIAVYKNVSEDTLKFAIHTKTIETQMFENTSALFCSSVDIPAIVDIDGDGDLDILSFWVPSYKNTLFFYKNMSQELYGHSDSLVFMLETETFGCFQENDNSNEIEFTSSTKNGEKDIISSVFYKELDSKNARKHTGSTIFITDLNDDGNKDILLGDFGSPNVVALYIDSLNCTYKIDTAFPLKDPVKIAYMPVITAIDIDKDGEKELIFSAFSPMDFDNNDDGIWVYKKNIKENLNISQKHKTRPILDFEKKHENNDNKALIEYSLQTKSFIKDVMLDFGTLSAPAVCDIDNDGLLDVVVGNYEGQLFLLKNIGTPSVPVFEIDTIVFEEKIEDGDNNYSYRKTLTQNAIHPSLADIDDDGLLEMVIGTKEGQLLWYKQSANEYKRFTTYTNEENLNTKQRVIFDAMPDNKEFLEDNIGVFLTPQLIDIDNDGLIDLIVGEQRTIWKDVAGKSYYKGNINFFKNIGSFNNPQFLFVTDSLWGIDVVDRDNSVYGHSVPCFIPSNSLLLCGSESGNIFVYENTNYNFLPNFNYNFHNSHNTKLNINFKPNQNDNYNTNSNTNFNQPEQIILNEGRYSSVSSGDFNGDGIVDIIVGNYRGGVRFFYGSMLDTSDSKNIQNVEQNQGFVVFPNPVKDILYIKKNQNIISSQPPHQKTSNIQTQSFDIIEIFDVFGRKKITYSSEKIPIDVSMLKQGLYFIKYGNKTAQFIKID